MSGRDCVVGYDYDEEKRLKVKRLHKLVKCGDGDGITAFMAKLDSDADRKKAVNWAYSTVDGLPNAHSRANGAMGWPMPMVWHAVAANSASAVNALMVAGCDPVPPE